ncbi:tigger transposable element-derived protein 6-like [Saccostrea cucullata]|uniref:tigger transposable element-derived protein 6-like n=1 Tax=Saccostrea cuccullata TaxID=36930 RepID=UPI002ED5E3B7
MSTPPAKRARVGISASLKKKICQRKVDLPRSSLQDLRQFVIDEENITIGKSTIGDVIKEKDKWLATQADSEGLTKSRNPKHQQLDDALYLWFTDMSAHHAAINDDMLLTKARQLGEQLGVTDFSYSRGYLHRFKGRRGIKRKLYQGEADSADMTAVQTGREDLQHVLQDYDPEDIFNLDETGLFYRLGPNYTLATKTVSGTKKSKDRITVALATNATGSTKIRAFVITKVNCPRCFGKTYNPETYVRYRHNTKAWMTSELFQEWLRDFDRQMRVAGRNVILLVDNAASHSQGDVVLRNVTLHFLPPNTTAHIQPMDAGIIKAFKAHYRKQLVHHYIERVEKKEEQSVNLREALHMVKRAWDSVKVSTIVNCYRHVQILPSKDDSEEDDDVPLSRLQYRTDEDDDDDIPLLQLQKKMRELPEACTMTAEEYVSVDAEEETGQHLTDDDIMTLVSREEVPEIADKDDEEEEVRKDVTFSQASGGIKMVISFFEQTSTSATSIDMDKRRAYLDHLWEMLDAITYCQARETTQKKMTDFFKQ